MSTTALEREIRAEALEKRTQAIGRELFAAARAEHERLSSLDRWTERVLSWCMDDPSVRAAVLRFIDVLPSLRGSRAVARALREHFPNTRHRLPIPLRLGSTVAAGGPAAAPALSLAVHAMVERVARQFIAETGAEGVSETVSKLADAGAACSLDVLGEQVVSAAEADAYAASYLELLETLTAAYSRHDAAAPSPLCGPLLSVSLKPSALSPRFDPVHPEASLEDAAGRLQPILAEAARREALVYLDMEHTQLRDLTLDLARRLLSRPEEAPDGPVQLGVVIQAYLQDSEEVVNVLLRWLEERGRRLTVRLVKGAYWDHEVAEAARHNWPAPVYRHKWETDACFERLTRRLLGAHPRVITAIGSHNLRSVAHAMAVAEDLGLRKEDLEFQVLYGMGDAIRAAVRARGYPVRVYVPVGDLVPGMAYLVRRILENTANESFLRQDFLGERSPEELLAPPAPSEEGVRVESEPPVQGVLWSAGRVTDAASAPRPGGAEWTGDPFLDFSMARHRDGFSAALESAWASLGRELGLMDDGWRPVPREALESRNPAHPGQVVGRVPLAEVEDVDRAVDQAAGAQRRWGRLPVEDRVARLLRAANLLRERRRELAACEVLEVGKTWREADADVVEAIDYLEFYSRRMLELARGKPLLQTPGERNEYLYQPRGVVAVIAPWNFPAAILTGMASAALVAGNAVILKPAEQSPVVAWHVYRALRDGGVPTGALHLLPGWGETVGKALVEHPGVHATLFTGSRAVGLGLLRASAQVPPGQRFVKHLVAEMGGKNALIVDEDADLDAAVQGVVASAFGYAGQKCSAASRLILHEAIYDRFLTRLCEATDSLIVAYPADPNSDLGPLIDEVAQRRLREAAERAEEVASVRYRYPESRLPPEGHYFGPCIVTDVPSDDPLAREELFGPLLSVFRVRSFEEALDLANDTDYALTGGVYSRSPSRLHQAAERFDVGNLYLNRPITGALVGRQPFGGHRLSGLGTKAGGPDYLLQLLVPKTITTNTARHGMPLE